MTLEEGGQQVALTHTSKNEILQNGFNCCRTRQQTLSSSNDDFSATAPVPSISSIVAHGEFEWLMAKTSRVVKEQSFLCIEFLAIGYQSFTE